MKNLATVLVLSLFFLHPAAAQFIFSRFQYDWGGNKKDYLANIISLPGKQYLIGGTSQSDPFCTKSSITYGAEDMVIFVLDDDGNKVWEKSYGGNNIDKLWDVQKVPAGGFILVGETASPPSGIKTSTKFGNEDIWVVRIDDNGNLLWEKTYGGINSEVGKKILPTSDGGFLIAATYASGAFNYMDYLVMKIDAGGNRAWSKYYGGSNDDILQDMLQLPNGNLLLSGCSNSAAGGVKTAPQIGSYDQWVICIQADGTRLWDRTFGGIVTENICTVTALNDGNYLVVGDENAGASGTLRKIDPQGNLLWARSCGPGLFRRASQATNGKIYVAGESYAGVQGCKTSPLTGGNPDYWITVYDAAGNKTGDLDYGGNADDFLITDIRAIDRDVWVLGQTNSGWSGNKTTNACGGSDGWIIRLSPGLYIHPPTPVTICSNDRSFNVDMTSLTQYQPGNVFTVQLSDINGSFSTYTNIGSINGTGSGLIPVTLPANLPAGNNYQIRAIASMPADTSMGYSITIHPQPKTQLNKDTVLCYGTTRTLTADPGHADYLWYDGQAGESRTVSAPGEYWVQITGHNGCITRDTETIKRIVPLPAGFLPADTTLCSYEDLNLQSTIDFRQHTWSTGDTYASILVQQPGLYWLQGIDRYGCTGRDSISISGKQCLYGFFMPTAFSPNNDGKNETCRPRLFGRIVKYHFAIFNRWGQKVFDSYDYTRAWDGRINGRATEAGTYVWSCSYQLQNKAEEHKKGTVVLVR
jgi:gliding motility-associated-like protein